MADPDSPEKDAVYYAYFGKMERLKAVLAQSNESNVINACKPCPNIAKVNHQLDLHEAMANKAYRDKVSNSVSSTLRPKSIISRLRKISETVTTPILNHLQIGEETVDIGYGQCLPSCTPLIAAASQGHVKVVEMLLNRGAKPHLTCSNSFTALHYATFFGHVEVVHLLTQEDESIRVNTASVKKITALHIATVVNSLALMALLDKSGADINLPANAEDYDANTALHWAVKLGHTQVVRFLLQSKDLAINALTHSQVTAVNLAIEAGLFLELAMLLADDRTSLNIPDTTGKLPVHLAVEKRNANMLWMILAHSHDAPFSNIDAQLDTLKDKEFFDHQIERMQTSLARTKSATREEYIFGTSRKRTAILINIRDFDQNNGRDLSQRKGSETDVLRLKETFQYLGFNIADFTDGEHQITAAKLRQKVFEFSRSQELEQHDAFAMVVMTHGMNNGVLLTTDGQIVKVNDILMYFTAEKCPGLAGKPKLFIIQACRGDDKEGEFAPLRVSQSESAIQTDSSPLGKADLVANWSDMLIAYSSVPQHVGFRHVTDGAVFIQKICQVFINEAHQSDVQELMNQVMEAMSSYKNKEFRQTCCIEYRGFWKKLFFPIKPEVKPKITKENLENSAETEL